MATQSTRKKATGMKQAAKASGKTATAKKATSRKPTSDASPKQPDDSNEIVVFAIRLARSERDLIHEAAGPAKASRFVKGAALAAANRDVDAFRAVVAEAQTAKK